MRRPRLDMTHGARLATAGLLLLVVLTGAGNLWATYDQVGNVKAAQATASRSAASVAQLCRTGNEFRAEQVTLWVHLVAISKPAAHQGAAAKRRQETQTRAFLAYIRRVFAPRHCSVR